MLCYVMLCCVMLLCYVMLCYVMLRLTGAKTKSDLDYE